MRVAILQPSYIPWRGYFDIIRSVDLFVFFDNVQFTRRDWRTRNRIKTPHGTEWLSVPVCHAERGATIAETRISDADDWRHRHLKSWHMNYARSAHYGDTVEILGNLDGRDGESIADLNLRLTTAICAYLGIRTPIVRATEISAAGRKTARLISILRDVGATAYLSGPSADAYIEEDAFLEAGISLEYKGYDYAEYPQIWGPFDGAVTILDLIANCGSDAANRIASLTPDRLAVNASAHIGTADA